MIPARTQEKLASEHPEGTRHKAKLDIALPLIAEGLPLSAVVETLRQKFPQASEKEIEGVVNWCAGRNPTPSGNGHAAPVRMARPKPSPPQEAVKSFVNGYAKPIASPVAIPDAGHAELLFRALYGPDEYLNIVCRFTTAERKGVVKANPAGSGANKRRDDWLAYFAANGIPQSEAGAWMRPNPVLEHGGGKDGATTNDDITAFRFLLLESDCLSVEEQLAVYDRLALPLSAILTSGGKSCHAWLRLDADDADDYAAKAERVYAALQRFGFDQANRNPSRLSRLVGAKRTIGGTGDGLQRLLYLAPEAKGITDAELDALEVRVAPAKFSFVPMKQAVDDALAVYEALYVDKGKSGLRTGFERFDWITGGLKKGWLTVVAGETNSGKTSFVLNMILNVLNAGLGVALFSFEMSHQEIMDIIFSRECEVSRNKFNNGFFSRKDIDNMTESVRIAKMPLYCFDDPMMSATDVSEAVKRLQNDHELSLVVIDYIQLANVENYRDSREQQVAYVSRMSKAMAKTAKVPVIAVSQLNEDGRVRESRAIAHDANCIISLSGENPKIEAAVVKGRSIPKGSYFFHFEAETCRFSETGCDQKLQALLPREPEPEKENDKWYQKQ